MHRAPSVIIQAQQRQQQDGLIISIATETDYLGLLMEA
jgi:hypothetical protein